MFADQPAVLKIYNKVEFESGGVIKNASEQAIKSSKALADSNAIDIVNRWESVHKIGPGFQNMGNTCFFNSVLQCITYTAPLANYLLRGEHKKVCQRTNSFCAICLIEAHTQQCFSANRPGVIQPRQLLANMRYINKRFKLGRQDDSHELLRLLLESMQKSALDFKTKTDQKQEEATPIYRIFAGKLKSQIECSQCKYRSENFETFYDVSLECKESVDKSLEVFFKKEHLKGNNKYRCSKCKKLVDATKGYVIHQLPNVLTLQVKRFNNQMMKINQHTVFPAELNMGKYVQDPAKNRDEMYDLFGVLVHIGGGLHFGHYYCYVKNSNNMWYCMNDSGVSQRSFAEVQKDRAYLLFYVKRETVARPRRKSSADLSSVNQAMASEVVAKPINGGVVVVEEKKTLKEEYKETMKSQAYEDHMKKLDSIFGIKANGKKDEATKQAETQPIAEETKESTSTVVGIAATAAKETQKETQIEIEEVKEEVAEAKEKKFKQPFYLPFYPVIRLKRIWKLRYLNDVQMRKQIKKEMMMENFGSYGDDHEEDDDIEVMEPQPKKKLAVQEEKKVTEVAKEVKQVQKKVEAPKQEQQLNTVAGKVVAEKPASSVLASSGSLLKALENKAATNTTGAAPAASQGTSILSLLSGAKKTETTGAAATASGAATGPSPLKLNALDMMSKTTPNADWNMQQTAKMRAARDAVMENNKQTFEYAKKEKDEYDVKYDEGKQKKIKKKKEKQRIDFDRLFSQKQKQNGKKMVKTNNHSKPYRK